LKLYRSMLFSMLIILLCLLNERPLIRDLQLVLQSETPTSAQVASPIQLAEYFLTYSSSNDQEWTIVFSRILSSKQPLDLQPYPRDCDRKERRVPSRKHSYIAKGSPDLRSYASCKSTCESMAHQLAQVSFEMGQWQAGWETERV
jgi:hypothetical protein